MFLNARRKGADLKVTWGVSMFWQTKNLVEEKKFNNLCLPNKIRLIKDCVRDEPFFDADLLARKLKDLGYVVGVNPLRMFLYHRMKHEHIKKVDHPGQKVRYTLI